MSSYLPFPAAHQPPGHLVGWVTDDGQSTETTSITWENEGFTVSGMIEGERVQYVLRLSAAWQLRQFLLFRDLDQPDLWLATDGHGRWGEMNGAHRVELDGCYDLALRGTPFTLSLPIRRLPLAVGDATELPVVVVDPETLAVRPLRQRFERIGSHRWHHVDSESGDASEFDVDEHGLVLDQPGRFRRAPVTP